MDKRSLSERDICTKFITPTLRGAGWDEMSQLREEVTFTAGRIVVRGKLVTRRKRLRADTIPYASATQGGEPVSFLFAPSAARVPLPPLLGVTLFYGLIQLFDYLVALVYLYLK